MGTIAYLAYISDRRYGEIVQELLKRENVAEDRFNRLALSKDIDDYVSTDPVEEVEEVEEEREEIVPLSEVSAEKAKGAIKSYIKTHNG